VLCRDPNAGTALDDGESRAVGDVDQMLRAGGALCQHGLQPLPRVLDQLREHPARIRGRDPSRKGIV
jgi:hypothetical protein